MRRWLADLITEVRALSALAQALLVVAGLASLAFVGWLSIGPARAALQAHDLATGSGLESLAPGAGFDPALTGRAGYRRALQAEIQRSVERLAPVESAEVQLALPEPGGAAARGAASIVLRLRPGAQLDDAQLQGIRQLVSGSAEGIARADVSILDDAGRLLAGGSGPVATADAAQADELERDLAARAESLLAYTVGAGRVAVRVRADLDRSEREETRERFDPDGQVERLQERGIEPAGAARAPGHATERVEYDVGKETTRAVTPAGGVKRLHVAVLLDGKPGAAGFTPWSAQELAQLESLVRQAVGFQADRGDELTLTNAPFRSAPPARFSPQTWALLGDALRAGAVLLGLGVLVALALRLRGDGTVLAGLPMSAAELEAALLARAGDGAAAALARAGLDRTPADEIVVRASLDRDAGTAALRAWLNER